VDRLPAASAAHRAWVYRFVRPGRLRPPARVDYVNGAGACPADGMSNVLGEIHPYDPMQVAHRYCGASFSYTHDGAVQQETLLNMLGAPLQALTYTAPDLAQLTQQGFEAPSAGTGVRYVQFTRDAHGRDVRVQFLYARGVPRMSRAGEYGYVAAYDDHDRLLSRSVLDDRGVEVGEVTRYAYNEHGVCLETRTEDGHGAPRAVDGYVSVIQEPDAWGNALVTAWVDGAGHPALTASGYASRSDRYDAQGNNTDTCYFDERGQPAEGDRGAECEHDTFDQHGRVVRSDLTGADGHRRQNAEGEAVVEFDYDARGNVIENRLYDGAGHLTEGKFGAGQHNVFDERGYLLRQDFFGADHQPEMTALGSTILTTVDERGNISEFRFFDTQGRPLVRPDKGYAVQRVLRDERGNVITRLFLGTDDKPVANIEGYASREMRYDDAGNEVERRMYDISHELTRDRDGVAVYRDRYDRLGRKIEERYFDEHEQPAPVQDGSYGYRADYDARGRMTTKVFLDAHGQVARLPALGYAGVRYRYGAQNRVAQEDFLDVDGQPVQHGAVAGMQHRYNDYGSEIERRWLDAQGHAVALPTTGCAAELFEFDRYQDPVVRRCVSADGAPLNRRDGGWAVKRVTRDHGVEVKIEYFDAAGNPVTPRK
ncbi:MAG TPA: hypothetical protein VHE37_16910, partial [Nevskiaceae bacterium]|nr:hypothetical protein [Nevskiaceae bacterium]